MFKTLQKSVFNKNKLLSKKINKRRVNKTPTKIIFQNRANLTFANIIVNMSSTPSISSLNNWNNSYFTMELYNIFFQVNLKMTLAIIKASIIQRIIISKILSIIINCIISGKSNEFLTYNIKLIEIRAFLRDNLDKNNKYIDPNKEINQDLLMLIYQTYFQIFSNNSII